MGTFRCRKLDAGKENPHRVSDRPIRVVEVTGDYRVGVYGVFRPQDSPAARICMR